MTEGYNELVSVITICRNSEKTIHKTIESVLFQSYKTIEYIIIDGNSIDATLEIINNYKESINKIISEDDLGIYDAFNKGITEAKGKYIQLVNADDQIEKHKILNCVNFMEKNPHIDVVLGDIIMLNSKGEPEEMVFGQEPNSRTKYHMGTLNHPTFFVRRRMYNEVKFRNYKIGMDFDWVLRATKSNYKFKKIQNNVVFMQNNGISRSNYKVTLREEYEIAKVNGANNLIAYLHFKFLYIKRFFAIWLEEYVPKKILYLFKPNKVYIK